MSNMRRYRLIVEQFEMLRLLLETREEALMQRFLPRIIKRLEENPTQWDTSALQDAIRQSEARSEDGKYKNEDLAHASFRLIWEADPDPKKSHVQWMLNKWCSKNANMRFYLEDLPSVSQLLQSYMALKKSEHRNKLTPEQKDINRFKTVSNLQELVLKYRVEEDGAVVDESEFQEHLKQADVLLNNSTYLVLIPKTREAAVYFGRDTDWCTAYDPKTNGRTHNYFDTYNDQGPLVIVIVKGTHDKWQFHQASGSYMDRFDRRIEVDSFRFHHPEVIEVINERWPEQTYEPLTDDAHIPGGTSNVFLVKDGRGGAFVWTVSNTVTIGGFFSGRGSPGRSLENYDKIIRFDDDKVITKITLNSPTALELINEYDLKPCEVGRRSTPGNLRHVDMFTPLGIGYDADKEEFAQLSMLPVVSEKDTNKKVTKSQIGSTTVYNFMTRPKTIDPWKHFLSGYVGTQAGEPVVELREFLRKERWVGNGPSAGVIAWASEFLHDVAPEGAKRAAGELTRKGLSVVPFFEGIGQKRPEWLDTAGLVAAKRLDLAQPRIMSAIEYLHGLKNLSGDEWETTDYGVVWQTFESRNELLEEVGDEDTQALADSIEDGFDWEPHRTDEAAEYFGAYLDKHKPGAEKAIVQWAREVITQSDNSDEYDIEDINDIDDVLNLRDDFGEFEELREAMASAYDDGDRYGAESEAYESLTSAITNHPHLFVREGDNWVKPTGAYDEKVSYIMPWKELTSIMENEDDDDDEYLYEFEYEPTYDEIDDGMIKVSQPHYGWSGHDEEVAVENFWDIHLIDNVGREADARIEELMKANKEADDA